MSDLYHTQTLLRRPLHVYYPAGDGRIVLRTDLDWTTDVEPISVSLDGTRHEFVVESDHPFLYLGLCVPDASRPLHVDRSCRMTGSKRSGARPDPSR